jgi:hypothetical protein
MNTIEKLGFDNWFEDKIDLSKTNDRQNASVISEIKNNQSLDVWLVAKSLAIK